MTNDEKRASIIAASIASEQLNEQVASAIFAARRDGWKVSPVQAMEDVILAWLNWPTYGQPMTTSHLAQWQQAAVIEIEAHFQDRYKATFEQFFGHRIDTGDIVEEAAALPSDQGKSFLGFLMARIPGEARAAWSNLNQAGRIAIGAAGAVVVIYAAAKIFNRK